MKGRVVKGKQLGKKLGYPTANLDVVPDIEEGVYYGTCILHGVEENMVMSVGYNPTTCDRSAEVHIYNKTFDDFYGEVLTIKISGYIRPMVKCDSLDALKTLINNDIIFATNLVGPSGLSLTTKK